VSTIAAPTRRRTVRRVWFPVAVLVVLGVAFAAVWLWPAEEFSRFFRVISSYAIVSLTLFLLLLWWLGLSGVRWSSRVALPIVIAILVLATVRKVDFSGDMVPLVRFRWQPVPGAVLEAYRQSHPAASDEELGAQAVSIEYSPSDYPEYRNRIRDGVARGPALARDWKAKPPRLLWKHPCGGGYAGISVVGDLAVTIEQRHDDEAIVCYDAATGRERWVYSYPAHFYDPRAEGPMATPTLVGSDVYSLGGTGWLVCLDLATGKLKWKVDVLADNTNLTWGMSGSPLVYDNFVVVSPGEQRDSNEGRAVVAYDRKTGKKVWGAGNERGGYSSPMLVTLCDVPQIVVFEGLRVAAYDPFGKGELWSVPWEVDQGINVAQPLVLGDDRLFVTSGYANRCGVVRLVKQKGETSPDAAIGISSGAGLPAYLPEKTGKLIPEEIWHNAALRCRFCSPVLYQGYIYGLDEGNLVCLDAKDGRRVWRGKSYRQSQLLRCEDLLLILTEEGDLALVQAAAEKSRELGRLKVLADDKTWSCPTLAGGKAYIRNPAEIACYDLRQ
jgi:outer membrane protein assembly factor BamB